MGFGEICLGRPIKQTAEQRLGGAASSKGNSMNEEVNRKNTFCKSKQS